MDGMHNRAWMQLGTSGMRITKLVNFGMLKMNFVTASNAGIGIPLVRGSFWMIYSGNHWWMFYRARSRCGVSTPEHALLEIAVYPLLQGRIALSFVV